MPKTHFTNKLFIVSLFILSISILFLGFQRNQWQVINAKKFNTFQRDVESYVVARMVISRQAGLFSYGGLIGWGDIDIQTVLRSEDYEHQFETYFRDQNFESYWTKRSHPSFQAIFFSALDSLSPLSSTTNFRSFRALTSALLALTFSGIIVWFYSELGLLSALIVLISLVISPWPTLFGRNLFFVTWVFYFPMLILLFWFRAETSNFRYSNRLIFWVVFVLILFKCLFNGYDFILPTLGMTATPLIFYAQRQGWDKTLFARRFATTVAAAFLAIISSFLILAIQVALATGEPFAGIDFILTNTLIRTSGLDTDTVLQTISLWSVLNVYFRESYLHSIHIPFWSLIVLFGGVSMIYWGLRKWRAIPSIPGDSLVLTTWFTLLSPLSWYIIFKSLAYYHTHMNYLPWLMPFTIFGFGLCGFVLETALRQKKKKLPNIAAHE